MQAYAFCNTGKSNWPSDTQLRPCNAIAAQFQFAYKCRGDTRSVPSRNFPLKPTQKVIVPHIALLIPRTTTVNVCIRSPLCMLAQAVLECIFKAPMRPGHYAACWRLGYMLPQLKATPEFFGPTLWYVETLIVA